MGKHDKHIELSSEEFVKNESDNLRKKLIEKDKELAFANDTIKELQKQCSRMSKWASEIEANAQDRLAEKDEYIRKLEKAFAEKAVEHVKIDSAV